MLIAAVVLTAVPVLAVALPGVPPLPAGLRISDRAGDLINPPRLETLGEPLVVSNSPETIRDISYPVALCRASLSSQHFRVFFHHLNAAAPQLQIGVAITNPANAPSPVELYVGYNSQLLPRECRRTVDYDPATAGWQAMRNWFVSRTRIHGDQWLHTLQPGQTRYIVQKVPYGATATGMYDFGVRSAGSDAAPPAVQVAVVAGSSLPPSVDMLPQEPADNGSYSWHRRGLFAHSERWGQVEADMTGVRWLDLAGPPEGEFSNIMPNEMEESADDPAGLNPGNYGVVYSLNVVLHNPTSQKLRVRCLLNAAGGPSFSGLMLGQDYVEAGKLLDSYKSWTYNTVEVAPGRRESYTIKFTLPGGGSGAHRLYFWPEAVD